ncbi:GspE/PulE family protein [Campylobacter geochelonis]|uniref:General secretion pathway protein E (Type II traffic warden ATPase)(Cholera toxin secretion protein EpsE) n=1 Tax=Campylobacter geochelonis TaxID=1780362 RepID=A0A128EJU5_9BACT|nr:GspE/PulE family protein [Campylobacter geochelonis]CZE49189.1 general secretion pathway protein E (Type II traffic warden ATPase)(cholera toxin secretion protein EpsE) [Campylobacter geochelonis]CZE49434.1 general secretion pathway protein E (Type II traffic warden ATPase)(cholera toxin secretion protein EpsE) [Campylobacter geochelonis]CZE51516.1 general secretion pathway protein E (Type II traffic warden ATPase)(cholera toxin secretion protein EpsE) [Campylobacter geochelonis]
MANLEKDILKILIKNGKIPQNADQEILEKMDIGLTLGEVLIGDNYMSEDEFALILSTLYKAKKITMDDINEKFSMDTKTFLNIFAKSYKMEYIDLDEIDIDYRISEKVSLHQLKKFKALPIKEDDLSIYVALKDPFDINAQDRMQALFSRKLLKVVLSDADQIEKYLAKLELSESIKGIVADIRKELASTTGAGADGSTSSGILQLIETIVKQSIISRGSDIHIEPTETNCIVRTRIDGMLTEIFIFDKDIYPPLVSRLKLLSNMDIAERRRPQDGRFSLVVADKEYDFRISTLPILNGESTVMRILDKSKVLISLEKLGMHPKSFAKFNSAMKAPYGIVLVTGPTGSGKTTTLYAALNDIKNVTTKIITVEDPVEYQLSMIQQVHVNEKAGLTFASALRSILRQDPDVIMIGEIRDQETLRIAIQAALTGHLVFSTLHTNDAVSAIPRMVDMGIEPYLISGSIVAIEAQRLVRKLCSHCKQPVNLPKSTLDKISQYLPQNYTFFKAVGCDKCSQAGYAGREMISEVLPISDKMQSLIANGASKEELKKVAYEEGYIDMFHDGIIRAANGVTSIEEIYRVAKE